MNILELLDECVQIRREKYMPEGTMNEVHLSDFFMDMFLIECEKFMCVGVVQIVKYQSRRQIFSYKGYKVIREVYTDCDLEELIYGKLLSIN